MFNGCESLKSLPDISKWNIKNLKNISQMCFGCSSLEKYPNLSNWDSTNIEFKTDVFNGCTSLKPFPNYFECKENNTINEKNSNYSNHNDSLPTLSEKSNSNDFNISNVESLYDSDENLIFDSTCYEYIDENRFYENFYS